MPKIWSELPLRRLKEQVADVATLIWVLFWGTIVWQLFTFLSGFAAAGRAVSGGGQTMIESGRALGSSLAGLPLVGSQARDVAQEAFARAGRPLSDFGAELEQFIVVVALAISVLLAIVTLAPWLARYLPWRLDRLGPRSPRSARPSGAGERRAAALTDGIERRGSRRLSRRGARRATKPRRAPGAAR